MASEESKNLVSPRGLKYIIIYLALFILPFLFFHDREGMTAIIFKTAGYITLPISLLLWLFKIELFRSFYWLHVIINIAINLLLLLWLGSFGERKNEESYEQ